MVQNPGKTLRLNPLNPVNLPEPLWVGEDSSGLPGAIKLSGKQWIIAIDDEWRIDDEWWRGEPVSRFYYTVRLASGQRIVLYKDLNNRHWYRQVY